MSASASAPSRSCLLASLRAESKSRNHWGEGKTKFRIFDLDLHQDGFSSDARVLQDLRHGLLRLLDALHVAGVHHEHHAVGLRVVVLPDVTDPLPASQVEDGHLELPLLQVHLGKAHSGSHVLRILCRETQMTQNLSCSFIHGLKLTAEETNLPGFLAPPPSSPRYPDPPSPGSPFCEEHKVITTTAEQRQPAEPPGIMMHLIS